MVKTQQALTYSIGFLMKNITLALAVGCSIASDRQLIRQKVMDLKATDTIGISYPLSIIVSEA